MNTLTYSLKEKSEIAEKVLKKIHSKIILFYGEMGSGKTTLIKEICAQLECEDVISSPTFSLVNEYHYPKGKIFHFDFYRIESEEEAWEIGFEEYLENDAFHLVEWPEKIPHLLPEKYTSIYLKKTAPDQRKLHLENKENN